MKLMIIKNSRSLRSVTELFGKVFKADFYNDCSGTAAMDLILRERPLFVSLKLKEPVNGDEDMMKMLSSIDVNTRLRVSIINSESFKQYLKSISGSFKNFILLGRHIHKLHTS